MRVLSFLTAIILFAPLNAHACKALIASEKMEQENILETAYYIGNAEILDVKPLPEGYPKIFDSYYDKFELDLVYELALKEDLRLHHEEHEATLEVLVYNTSCSRFHKEKGVVIETIILEKDDNFITYPALEKFENNKLNTLRENAQNTTEE